MNAFSISLCTKKPNGYMKQKKNLVNNNQRIIEGNI